MLAQNKIFAKEKLMLIHLTSFFIMTIIITIEEIMIFTGAIPETIDIDSMSERSKRILLA